MKVHQLKFNYIWTDNYKVFWTPIAVINRKYDLLTKKFDYLERRTKSNGLLVSEYIRCATNISFFKLDRK